MKGLSGYRNILITAVLGAGVLAYVVCVFVPTRRHIREVSQQIAQQQDYITQTQPLAAQIKTVSDQLESITARNVSWQQNSPRVAQLAPVFKQVSQQAAESGVRTLEFDPQPVDKLHLIARVPLVLSCEGTFAQLFDFLARLEALPAVVQVDDLRISGSEKDAGNVLCEVTLVVFADNRKDSN